MATNRINQVAYAGKDSCLIPASLQIGSKPNAQAERLYPTNVLGSAETMGDFSGDVSINVPYQQIILNGSVGNMYSGSANSDPITFKNNTPYYLRLQLPRDAVYDMNFALLLLEGYGQGDLDNVNYQFIRYIHVPKQENAGVGTSEVVLFEYPSNNPNGQLYTGEEDKINVKIAKPLLTVVDEAHTKEKEIFSDKDMEFLWYYGTGEEGDHSYYEIVKNDDGTYDKKLAGGVKLNSTGEFDYNEIDTTGAKGPFYPIGLNSVVLTHSWVSKESSEIIQYELIFAPRDQDATGTETKYTHLYLYLLPSLVDNDILWLENTGNELNNEKTAFYGRHIDLNLYYGDAPQAQIELYEMKNLLGNNKPERIGIWGRSELLFAINGEEIRIGPSGYYELRNFNIESVGVAAMSNADQFTIDYQY